MTMGEAPNRYYHRPETEPSVHYACTLNSVARCLTLIDTFRFTLPNMSLPPFTSHSSAPLRCCERFLLPG